eukprot:EC836840.1.p4 GENE.EC836840.1~~EC836840.1.p4  ORF type:complete len:71 (-),score=7.79 EC836840.1:181-393(-)
MDPALLLPFGLFCLLGSSRAWRGIEKQNLVLKPLRKGRLGTDRLRQDCGEEICHSLTLRSLDFGDGWGEA